jgi:hypothetical protein
VPLTPAAAPPAAAPPRPSCRRSVRGVRVSAICDTPPCGNLLRCPDTA